MNILASGLSDCAIMGFPNVCCYIGVCLLGNATNNLMVLDLTLDLLDIRQAELQLIITLSILLLTLTMRNSTQ
jgi:hypothetical protein